MSILSLRTLICCALLCTVCSIYAQFNIKVGYNGNYANLEKTTSIFDRFSSKYTSDNQELKSINFFHGIEFGARYKLSKNFGFDFGISATNGKSKASDLTLISSELSEIEWKISQNSIYIGLENYFGIFGYGASIGYQNLKYKNKTNLISEDIEVLNQNALNSRFYLIFEFASNKNAFSFRPFVSINWQSYNVYNIELTSFPNSNLISTDFKEDFMVYGISFMIYNGPQ